MGRQAGRPKGEEEEEEEEKEDEAEDEAEEAHQVSAARAREPHTRREGPTANKRQP